MVAVVVVVVGVLLVVVVVVVVMIMLMTTIINSVTRTVRVLNSEMIGEASAARSVGGAEEALMVVEEQVMRMRWGVVVASVV